MIYIKKIIVQADIARLTLQLLERPERVSDSPVCDFCGEPEPMFIYASWAMSTGEPVACWRWCACSDCSIAVDSLNWDTLLSRITTKVRSMLPAEIEDIVVERSARRALRQFHLTALWRP